MVIKENCSCFATDEAASQFTSRYLVPFQEQIVPIKSCIIKTKTKQNKTEKNENSGIMKNKKKKPYTDESALFQFINCVARLKR